MHSSIQTLDAVASPPSFAQSTDPPSTHTKGTYLHFELALSYCTPQHQGYTKHSFFVTTKSCVKEELAG